MSQQHHDPQQQRRQIGVLRAVVEQQTARLHSGELEWVRWLECAARYGSYGFANTLLIAAHNSAAMLVHSYDGWQTHGRQVGKGERGIRILSQTGKPYSVFDVSQTEGSALAGPPTVTAGQVYDQLRRLVEDRYVLVNRGRGFWHLPLEPDPMIHIDPALDDAQAAQLLAHQLGHLLLHRGEFDQAQGCHGVRRVEADSIAYLVLACLGLDPHPAGFSQVADWAGTDPRARPLATITMVASRIVRTAGRIRRQLAKLPPAPIEETAEPAVDEHADLLAMHEVAHAFFQAQRPAGWVPAYLAGRGIDAAVADRWEIGHAPKTWRALTDQLRQLGYDDERILACGLGRRTQGGKLFDTFRDRAVFPIRTMSGRVVGFIGRRHDDADGPKYLNSPDTPIFHKSDLLYGLYETREALAAGARPVLVEGPFDAIAVNTAAPGHYAAVAPCGTAFTEAQLDALGQATNLPTTGVLLALDGDQAGHDAAVRAWAVLSQVEGPVGVVIIPGNQDPADLMRYQGPMAVRDALTSEVPLVDLVIDTRIDRAAGSAEFFEQRWAAAKAAATVIAALPPGQIAHQVARVAARLHLQTEIVTEAVLNAISPAEVAAGDFPLPPLADPYDQPLQASTRSTPNTRPQPRRSL